MSQNADRPGRNPAPPEKIEIVDSGQPDGSLWQPRVGPETQQLLDHIGLDGAGKQQVLEGAVEILAKCLPPSGPNGRQTGLVVGHIQSGKTLSFTTVAALARDNGYRLVIVITGISKYLFDQSKGRLYQDLRIQTREDRAWVPFSNPSPTAATAQNIKGTLEAWRDSNSLPSQRLTQLVIVMKNRKRLDNLIAVLSGLDLQGVPVLVIDDEADQAGLNTLVRQGDASATYQRLLALRDCLPHHTFLQITATPQAPLLINLIDILSPNFACILTPGDDYVGGADFFVQRRDLIRTIPAAEIPSKTNRLREPPESLLEALRLFFLEAASGHQQQIAASRRNRRSMMVHPSEKVFRHAEYLHWVTAIRDRWITTLGEPLDDPDRQALVEEFRQSWQELRRTVTDLASFEELLKQLPLAIRTTFVHQVNSQSPGPADINWDATYSHILIGGQAMDRGFTVEGLTVTYMPRGVGGRQADTIQQRGRFFGYKRPYLGYCRVFLEDQTRDVYTKYVEHEDDLRNRLDMFRRSGKPLSEWRRAFLLTTDLRPTRQSVLGLDYMQDRLSNEWFWAHCPHCSPNAVETNRTAVDAFCGRLRWQNAPGHADRTPIQHHLIAEPVSLSETYEELLTAVRFPSPRDSGRYTGLLLQVEAYLEQHPDTNCTIYRMSHEEERRRTVDDAEEIEELFQGAYPVNPRAQRGKIYPGDRLVYSSEGLTVQIHTLTLTRGDARKVIAQNVLTLAIWVPAEMSVGWLVQHQSGST